MQVFCLGFKQILKIPHFKFYAMVLCVDGCFLACRHVIVNFCLVSGTVIFRLK